MLNKLYHKYYELISYVFFGVLTTVVNILTFALLQAISPEQYLLNNTIAWLVSVLFAFITNKLFVFHSKTWNYKFLAKEIILFFGTRILTLFVDNAIMIAGIKYLKLDTMITKILDQIIVILLNFVFSKLSFKHKKFDEEQN